MIEDVSGKKAETVLERSEAAIFFRTLTVLSIWSVIAFIMWFLCMKLQGILLGKLVEG